MQQQMAMQQHMMMQQHMIAAPPQPYGMAQAPQYMYEPYVMDASNYHYADGMARGMLHIIIIITGMTRTNDDAGPARRSRSRESRYEPYNSK